MTSIDVRVKRVYEPPDPRDGKRFLVERLWPRGFTKAALRMEGWLKDIAPSDGLRRWFGHDPAKWKEFQRRYQAELDANPDAWHPLLEAARRGRVTLLYSARDQEHNNAVVLRNCLPARLGANARTTPNVRRATGQTQPKSRVRRSVGDQ